VPTPERVMPPVFARPNEGALWVRVQGLPCISPGRRGSVVAGPGGLAKVSTG
jgi:hypothetical protein